MGSLLRESREYEKRKKSLSPADRKRLEFQEHEIATGTEEYRAADLGDVRIHYFDYGFISFLPLNRDETMLIAFRFLDQP